VAGLREKKEMDLAAAVERGAVLDPDAAENCALSFITTTCTVPGFIPSCLRMFYNPRGWPSITSCAHHADCARPAEGYGFCDPKSHVCEVVETGPWKPCDSLCESDPMRFCDSKTGLCQPRPQFGESCVNFKPCAPGLICETGWCGFPPDCSPSCGQGEFCAATDTCVAEKGLGEPCGDFGVPPRYECRIDEVDCREGLCGDCTLTL
jgi:hypothetical protein